MDTGLLSAAATGSENTIGVYLLLCIAPMLLGLYAQWKVKSAFNEWKERPNSRQMTGAEAAADMLAREGVRDVRIEQTAGVLSDHYDPSAKLLRLSGDIYSGRSVAALGIACHEAGHALQHAQNYGFLGLRSLLVPTVKIGSYAAVPLVMAGLMLGALGLAKIGVALYALIVLFQIVTLPVEFDASRRAKLALVKNRITRPDEDSGVSAVLDAAAMTYVAATVAAIGQLLYFILLVMNNRQRR